MEFLTPHHLDDWLRSQSINTSQWGTGIAKSTDDLWHEIVVGESLLQFDPLLRIVQVASVLVTQGGRQLIESVQIFRDGRKRYPQRLPSEKMKPNETPEAAAIRCLHEEVAWPRLMLLSQPQLINTQTRLADSPSYPGLTSEFTLHTVKVEVQGLPRSDFVTINQASQDPVASFHWRWIERSDGASQ